VRFVNAGGRAGVSIGGRVVDVERGSGGRFASDPMSALARWDELRSWAEGVPQGAGDAPLDETTLGPCAPRPAKVFGIGLNYRSHAAEAGLELPKQPLVFTKFPNCLVGPRADVVLTSERVDYEVELVAVIGRGGRWIGEARALDHVAGYCVGQDISDRALQFADKPPQFSLGKSADSFGPIGPALVTLDAFADPDDLPLWCEVSGERLQEDRTSQLIFPVGELVAYLSRFCTLLPGDLIFTGTPAGVGSTRDPRRYLAPGDEIASGIDGIGTLRNRCVAGERRPT
jgi:2-keto-4-pentenoate hydratase/2-oxohepta-3-ene-1,7-dioic acid hydratase in catechol pathway